MGTQHKSVEVTWGRALRIWWSIVWRDLLLAVAVALPVRVIVSIVCALLGLSQPMAEIITGMVTTFAGIAISIGVIRSVFRKELMAFRSSLIAKDTYADGSGEILPN